MPWARAVMHGGLGAALLDWWALSPLEAIALARASKNELTESEERAKEIESQRQLAAMLRATLPPCPPANKP